MADTTTSGPAVGEEDTRAKDAATFAENARKQFMEAYAASDKGDANDRAAYEAKINEAQQGFQQLYIHAGSAEAQKAFDALFKLTANQLGQQNGTSTTSAQSAAPAGEPGTDAESQDPSSRNLSRFTGALRNPRNLAAMSVAVNNLPVIGPIISRIPFLGQIAKLLGALTAADYNLSLISGKPGQISSIFADHIDKAANSATAGKVITTAAKAAAPVVGQAAKAVSTAINNGNVQAVARKINISPEALKGVMDAVQRAHTNVSGKAEEASGPIRPISRDEAGIDQASRAKT